MRRCKFRPASLRFNTPLCAAALHLQSAAQRPHAARGSSLDQAMRGRLPAVRAAGGAGAAMHKGSLQQCRSGQRLMIRARAASRPNTRLHPPSAAPFSSAAAAAAAAALLLPFVQPPPAAALASTAQLEQAPATAAVGSAAARSNASPLQPQTARLDPATSVAPPPLSPIPPTALQLRSPGALLLDDSRIADVYRRLPPLPADAPELQPMALPDIKRVRL